MEVPIELHDPGVIVWTLTTRVVEAQGCGVELLSQLVLFPGEV